MIPVKGILFGMAATSRKAFKLLKRSFSSKDTKEDVKVFSYNVKDLDVHQIVSLREEALSDVRLDVRIN